jgi:hypothetical protein
VAYSSDGTINSRNEPVLVRERYLGGASVTSRNCLRLSESPATQWGRSAKHEIGSDSNGEAPDASLWKGCSPLQQESFDGGQVGESGRIEWVVEGQAKPIEEGVQQEALRVDWLGYWLPGKEIRG